MNTTTGDSDLLSRVGILLLLWMAGVYLRLPVLITPPLVPFISADLDLNQTQLGALTTLPVLMLSLGALPGSWIIARLGPLVALVVALFVVALSSIARSFVPPVWLLFLNTTLLGLAIAVMQPAFPALLLRWCPGFIALGSAVYMNGMLMGEFVGGGLTLPLVMPLLDDDWRQALILWSLPAIPVALLLLLGRNRDLSGKETDTRAQGAWMPEFRHARIWHTGMILGAASAAFFGTNAYLPSLLAAQGRLDFLQEFLLIINGTQVVGSLLMVMLARILVGSRWPVIIMAWSILIGVVGVVFGNLAVALMATLLLGLSTCIQLILIVGLVPQIAGTRDAAPLAAGMFTISYLLAFVMPLVGGFLADYLADARITFLPCFLLAVVAVYTAHRSSYLSSR